VQRETSLLYEKAGVNPLAGCLPSLATIPIFIGLYRWARRRCLLGERGSGGAAAGCRLLAIGCRPLLLLLLLLGSERASCSLAQKLPAAELLPPQQQLHPLPTAHPTHPPTRPPARPPARPPLQVSDQRGQ
jgi:hypothetical protein